MGLDLHEFGRPHVDPVKCTGCGQCAAICPGDVLTMQQGLPVASEGLVLGCIACGHCMAICPTEAIRVSGRGMQADDAVAFSPTMQKATAEQFEALLFGRRSIRKFTDEPVDRATLDKILEMAATAPMGIPPHEASVVVFDSRDKVRQLREIACEAFRRTVKFFNPVTLAVMRPFIGKAQATLMKEFVRPLCRTIAEQHAQGRDVFAYDPPALMIFHYSPEADVADAVIVATYAMLAAESLGLGSCMLGTTVALSHFKDLKAKLGIPEQNKVSVGLALGHPAVEFRRGVRRRLASVIYA